HADVVLLPLAQHVAQRLHVPVRGHAAPGAMDRPGATAHALLAHRARHRPERRGHRRPMAGAALARWRGGAVGQPRLAALQQKARLMPRPRTDIRVRILHAARARFAAKGVDGSSLRSIAADARTSIGMIYYYFPSKDALFLAVVEEVYGNLLG